MAGKNAKPHGSNRAQQRSERRQAKQQKHDAQAQHANDPRRDQHHAGAWQPERAR